MRLFRSFNKYKNNIAIIDNENSNLSYKQILKETNKIKKKIKNKISNINYFRKFSWFFARLYILYYK
jgi:hypothetical protein